MRCPCGSKWVGAAAAAWRLALVRTTRMQTRAKSKEWRGRAQPTSSSSLLAKVSSLLLDDTSARANAFQPRLDADGSGGVAGFWMIRRVETEILLLGDAQQPC